MRKASGILADTTELKKLILEHPDYPIVVLVSEEANSGDYSWMYASDITFAVGEILDNSNPLTKNLFILTEILLRHKQMKEEGSDCELDEEAFQVVLKKELQQYEPCWKSCIIIYADN